MIEFRKILNMLKEEGEGGKYTPKTSDHHHPFYHKIDKERLPSWPCQEGIRSKHLPHKMALKDEVSSCQEP